MGTHPIFESDFDCLTEMEISVTKLLRICAFLPSAAFFLCLFTALWSDWTGAVDTICRRDGHSHHPVNYLPSISMLISSKQPMLFIWRTFLGLHFFPRLMLGLHFAQRHEQLLRTHGKPDLARKLLYLFYYADLIGLITLTYVQSNEYFPVHKLGFALFLIASVLHIIASRIVNSAILPNVRQLKRVFYLHIASIALCMYCYYSHNAHCQDYTYTFFAMFEYMIVFTNIAFHYHSGNIFGSSILMISSTDSQYNLLPQ